MTPQERYEDLVDEFTGAEGITPPPGGSGFGRGSLRYRGKIFAMFVRGQLVLKLPRDRVDELVADGYGVRFDANKGTPMKEWFSLDPESALAWSPLAREALDFARDGRAGPPPGQTDARHVQNLSAYRRGPWPDSLGTMDLQVADHPDAGRFEIRADGDLAGFVQYNLRGEEIAFIHTETDDRFRGHGVGSFLVRSALDAARERNLAVLPYCPFVNRWLAGHHEYADLVPVDRRPEFGL